MIWGTRNERSGEIVVYQKTRRDLTDNFYDKAPLKSGFEHALLWTSAREINHADGTKIYCVYWGNTRATKVIYIRWMMKLWSWANQSEDATGISISCARGMKFIGVSWLIDSVTSRRTYDLGVWKVLRFLFVGRLLTALLWFSSVCSYLVPPLLSMIRWSKLLPISTDDTLAKLR